MLITLHTSLLGGSPVPESSPAEAGQVLVLVMPVLRGTYAQMDASQHWGAQIYWFPVAHQKRPNIDERMINFGSFLDSFFLETSRYTKTLSWGCNEIAQTVPGCRLPGTCWDADWPMTRRPSPSGWF